ncbi:MAG TPA: 5-methyltetrahydropteroyltriglutamate--homocysteine methyltransferase, partial [Niallia sp.]|nr:5-methyltetrahydropteroyltriglutamate--homocysteine methyltransferase [Niallia sp.]
MTKTIKAPFRYDHVGSFLRPKVLKEARSKFQKNEITYAELKKVEDEEIIRLIEKQKEIGILS